MVDKHIEKIIKTVESAPDKFNGNLPAVERKILDEITELLKDLKTNNGKIVSCSDNLKIVTRIQKRLEKIVFSKQYLNDVARFVSSYHKIATYHNQYFSQLDNFKPKQYYNMVKTVAMENAIDALTETGINANVIKPLRDVLLTAVTSGQGYASLTESLRNEIIGTEESPGSLSRYARTYTTTAISMYNGQYSAAVNADIGYEWYAYRGSNIETTREFCEKMTEKEWVHVSEFEAILSGDIDGYQCEMYEKTDLPRGLMAGTTPENFIVRAGGWNCQHSLYPVPEYLVPEEVRNKMKENQLIFETIRNEESDVMKMFIDKQGGKEVFVKSAYKIDALNFAKKHGLSDAERIAVNPKLNYNSYNYLHN